MARVESVFLCLGAPPPPPPLSSALTTYKVFIQGDGDSERAASRLGIGAGGTGSAVSSRLPLQVRAAGDPQGQAAECRLSLRGSEGQGGAGLSSRFSLNFFMAVQGLVLSTPKVTTPPPAMSGPTCKCRNVT